MFRLNLVELFSSRTHLELTALRMDSFIHIKSLEPAVDLILFILFLCDCCSLSLDYLTKLHSNTVSSKLLPNLLLIRLNHTSVYRGPYFTLSQKG